MILYDMTGFALFQAHPFVEQTYLQIASGSHKSPFDRVWMQLIMPTKWSFSPYFGEPVEKVDPFEKKFRAMFDMKPAKPKSAPIPSPTANIVELVFDPVVNAHKPEPMYAIGSHVPVHFMPPVYEVVGLQFVSESGVDAYMAWCAAKEMYS